jgi:hypothetical protein
LTRTHQPLHAACSEPDRFLNASASNLPPSSRRRPPVSTASPQTLASSPAMPCVHAHARKKGVAPSDLDRTATYRFDRPGPGQAAKSGPAQVRSDQPRLKTGPLYFFSNDFSYFWFSARFKNS